MSLEAALAVDLLGIPFGTVMLVKSSASEPFIQDSGCVVVSHVEEPEFAVVFAQDWTLYSQNAEVWQAVDRELIVRDSAFIINSSYRANSQVPGTLKYTTSMDAVASIDWSETLAQQIVDCDIRIVGDHFGLVGPGMCITWGPCTLPWYDELSSLLDKPLETLGSLWSLLVVADTLSVNAEQPSTLVATFDAFSLGKTLPRWCHLLDRDSRLYLTFSKARVIVNGKAEFSLCNPSEQFAPIVGIPLAVLVTAIDILLPESGLDVKREVRWYPGKAGVAWSNLDIQWDSTAVTVNEDTVDLATRRVTHGHPDHITGYASRRALLEELSQHHAPLALKGIYIKGYAQDTVVSMVWPRLLLSPSGGTFDLATAATWQVGDRVYPDLSVVDLFALKRALRVTVELDASTLHVIAQATPCMLWDVLSVIEPDELCTASHRLDPVRNSALCRLHIMWNTLDQALRVVIERDIPSPTAQVYTKTTTLVMYAVL
jgi:hypothetical protein